MADTADQQGTGAAASPVSAAAAQPAGAPQASGVESSGVGAAPSPPPPSPPSPQGAPAAPPAPATAGRPAAPGDQTAAAAAPAAGEGDALGDALAVPALGLMLDVPLEVAVEIGRVELPLAEVLALQPGGVLRLNRAPGEPLDLLVNGRCVARGEILVVNEAFAFRVVEIVSRQGGARAPGAQGPTASEGVRKIA